MKKDTSSQSVEQSEAGLSLEELIRRSARDVIQKAVEVEVQQLLAEYENVRMLGGSRAVVRNGYLPAREVLTAVGNVEVRVPKVRDRSGNGVIRRWYRPMFAAPSGYRRRCRGCI